MAQYRISSPVLGKTKEQGETDYKIVFLQDFLNMIVSFLEQGNKVIFVLDESNLPSDNSEEILKNSSFTKERSEMKSFIPINLYADIKSLLNLLGIPTISTQENIHEEITKVFFSEKWGGVVTEDLTFLAFGIEAIVRYVDPLKGIVKKIDLEAIKEETGLSQAGFSDLWILYGCDYSKNFSLLSSK